MINNKLSAAELIEMFYDKEIEEDVNASVVKQSLTARPETPYATMLNALARRFGQTRGSIIQHIIEAETLKMFNALSEKDKKALAEEADLETTKIMLELGHSITSVGLGGKFENEWSEWRSHVATLDYFKKEKDEEKC